MTAAKTPSKKVPETTHVERALPTTADAAYAHFLAEAKALPDERVVPFRYEVALAAYNVGLGVDAVTKRLPELRALGLSVDAVDAIVDIPALLLGFSHACARAEAETTTDGQTTKKVARAFELRALLLAAIGFAVAAKLTDDREYKRIKRGSGPRDTAQDLHDAAVLLETPALVGKFPQITPALLSEAKALSAELLALLKPSTAKKRASTTDAREEALEMRHRFGALLVARHDGLWRYGALLFGREVDSHVPALSANRAAFATATPDVAKPPSSPIQEDPA